MNAAQAKLLSLPEIMERLGFMPTQVAKVEESFGISRPFGRKKTLPFTSFLGGKWIWNDFGDDGGTVIDFVMRLKGYRQVGDALAFLENMYKGRSFRQAASAPGQTDLFSFQQQVDFLGQPEAASRELEFVEATVIRNPLIYSYLTKERALPRRLVDLYFKEVKYRNKGREYFAIGMENASGGYEIRSASDAIRFKSALPKRDISVVAGASPEKGVVSVFEGMTDFLSLLAMMKLERLGGDAVIMHSLSSYPRTSEYLRGRGYEVVHTFLDNDGPGRECTERFKADFPGRVVSQSGQFEPYVDLNDALRANQVPQFLSM